MLGPQVEPSNKDSNCLMINKSLLVPPQSNKACFYPIPIDLSSSPQNSANAYSELIKDIFNEGPPIFDFVLLGLGDDGHTASLFPGNTNVFDANTYIAVGEGKGTKRVTMTPTILNSSRRIVFMVSGKSKQVAIERLLDPLEPAERTPAKLIKSSSEILILADKQACPFYS